MEIYRCASNGAFELSISGPGFHYRVVARSMGERGLEMECAENMAVLASGDVAR